MFKLSQEKSMKIQNFADLDVRLEMAFLDRFYTPVSYLRDSFWLGWVLKLRDGVFGNRDKSNLSNYVPDHSFYI